MTVWPCMLKHGGVGRKRPGCGKGGGENRTTAAGSEGAHWRVGAVGWKFSRMDERARTARLPDAHGQRCHYQSAGVVLGGGVDLGCGGGANALDRTLRGAAGALQGLEERVCAHRQMHKS